MFDLTSSKLFLLAVVALLVIGPKDFPILLRTIGKYVGIIRGHAKEFRAQFDEAMRETELSQLKKEMENIGRETEASLNATRQSVEQTMADARQSVEASVQLPENPLVPSPLAANGLVENPLAPAAEPPAQPVAQPGSAPAVARAPYPPPFTPPSPPDTPPETAVAAAPEAEPAAAPGSSAPKTPAESAVERSSA